MNLWGQPLNWPLGLEKLPQKDPSNVEICPVVKKLQPQKSEKSSSGEHSMVRGIDLDNFLLFPGRGTE